MKSFFHKIFDSKYETTRINIGEILSKKELLIAVFPPELDISYQLLSFIAGMKYQFLYCQLYFHENFVRFFKQISSLGNIEILPYQDFMPKRNAILFNFWKDCDFRSDIVLSENSLLMDIDNSMNVEITPYPKSELEFFENATTIFSFPFSQSKLQIELIRDRSHLFHNSDIHIVMYITSDKNAKYYESIIKTIKQDFGANFYLTGIPYDGDAFINVKNIKDADLFQNFIFATNSNLFISDDKVLLTIFQSFSNSLLYFGKNNTFSTIPCLLPKDVFELKNRIQEICERKD